MSTPVSPVEVCNLALDLLRHNTLIASIDTPETEVESLAARWYDATRRSVLRMFPWNFARKRAALSRVVGDPAFGYADAYQLPTDFSSIVFIGDDIQDNIVDFVVEADQILINNEAAATLNVCYVRDFETVAKFDPIFVNLLVGELALVFGNAIAGLNKSLTGMEKFRDRWEAKARAKNGQENPPRIRYESPLLNARRSGRRSTATDGIHLFNT